VCVLYLWHSHTQIHEHSSHNYDSGVANEGESGHTWSGWRNVTLTLKYMNTRPTITTREWQMKVKVDTLEVVDETMSNTISNDWTIRKQHDWPKISNDWSIRKRLVKDFENDWSNISNKILQQRLIKWVSYHFLKFHSFCFFSFFQI
jgi:hypothetical protein